MIHSQLVIRIGGRKRVVDASVFLTDLSRKLRGMELESGDHQLVVLQDGSLMLNGTLIWQPKSLHVQKVG